MPDEDNETIPRELRLAVLELRHAITKPATVPSSDDSCELLRAVDKVITAAGLPSVMTPIDGGER